MEDYAMEGAGSVAAGGAAPATAHGGAPAAAAGTAPAAAVDTKPTDNSQSAAVDKVEKSGEHVQPPGNAIANMNTINFIQLHNTSVTQINETQSSGEIDWKKLIEMMIAIKLLQEMGKSQ